MLTEAELKRALAVIMSRRHAQRDRLALLLTHWAGMRVCDVAARAQDKVLSPTGEGQREWRLESQRPKSSFGRVESPSSLYIFGGPAIEVPPGGGGH